MVTAEERDGPALSSRDAPAGAEGMLSMPTRVQSISDQVSHTVREMILMGRFLPGSSLKLDELAREIGVSTMPVREALLRLSQLGLVDGGRGRAFRVARTTREDIGDIYWLHAMIQGELAAKASRSVDPQALTRIESAYQVWVHAAARGESGSLEAANFALHKEINMAASAPKLVISLRNTLQFIPHHFYALIPEWLERSVVDHRVMTDAIRAHDEEQAREAATSHVLEAGRMLTAYFDAKGFWRRP